MRPRLREQSKAGSRLVRERSHAPAACWAVVEVLLREFAAVRAETQVLDRPWQPRGGGGERQYLADDLQPIAGVAVQIDLSGLGLDHDLPPAGGAAQAIALTVAHPRNCT